MAARAPWSETLYQELPGWADDAVLCEALHACVAAQRAVLAQRPSQPAGDPRVAEDAVRAGTLARLLERGDDVHGISRQPEIARVVTFNIPKIAGSIADSAIARAREALDDVVAAKIRSAFGWRWSVSPSGHFLYPPGGYMGWHTNSGAPGWRLYLTHAETPGQSFFRYRDPSSCEIVTSQDRAFDARMFRVGGPAPLWHAVFSRTNRFSFGYVIHRPSPWQALLLGIRRLRGHRRASAAPTSPT